MELRFHESWLVRIATDRQLARGYLSWQTINLTRSKSVVKAFHLRPDMAYRSLHFVNVPQTIIDMLQPCYTRLMYRVNFLP